MHYSFLLPHFRIHISISNSKGTQVKLPHEALPDFQTSEKYYINFFLKMKIAGLRNKICFLLTFNPLCIPT